MSPQQTALSGRSRAVAVALPVAALLGSMASIQVGAALAQRMFPLVGAQGATALRVSLAAAILLLIHRPSPRALGPAHAKAILAYGLSLGAMNLLFYLALRTIPLGVAVALEFTGPLLVAALSHRGRLDILWLLLAAGGLAALAPWRAGAAVLDPTGLLLALGAGGFWALYILFGQRAGQAGHGAATAWGMLIAACVVVPFGVAHAGAALLTPSLLPIALTVAVMSSALPYSLEMAALTRLPKATFSNLMSLEPAIAAVAGWLLLGQRLTLRQDLAIACIIVASVGTTAALVSGEGKTAPLPG